MIFKENVFLGKATSCKFFHQASTVLVVRVSIRHANFKGSRLVPYPIICGPLLPFFDWTSCMQTIPWRSRHCVWGGHRTNLSNHMFYCLGNNRFIYPGDYIYPAKLWYFTNFPEIRRISLPQLRFGVRLYEVAYTMRKVCTIVYLCIRIHS